MNMSLQNSSSPLMEQLIMFHDHTMLVLVLITIFIMYSMTIMMTNTFTNSSLMEGQTIEIIWTIVPAFILMFIAMPSLRALYLIDEVKAPAISIKTIGHQWYWSYEYSDFMNLEFDSYMIPSKDCPIDSFRLLEVDNRTIIPYNTQVRMLITATDVLHSWTIPAIGIKIDAIPGRLNQTSFMVNHPGLLYGQCSEICGANHSFMPIVLEMISPKDFIKWVNSNL